MGWEMVKTGSHAGGSLSRDFGPLVASRKTCSQESLVDKVSSQGERSTKSPSNVERWGVEKGGRGWGVGRGLKTGIGKKDLPLALGERGLIVDPSTKNNKGCWVPLNRAKQNNVEEEG